MAHFSILLLTLLVTVTAANASRTLLQGGPNGPCSSVFDLVSTNPELSTLKTAIEAAGLESKPPPLVIFLHSFFLDRHSSLLLLFP